MRQAAVLEDQPAHVAPEEAHQGTVRIGAIVGVLVMHPMDRDPACRRVLQRADAQQCEGMLQPFRTPKTPMSEQAVVSDIDPQRTEHVVAQEDEHHARPGEEIGAECEWYY